MNIFKSCKKTITYLVILSMVVAGVVPTSFVKAEEENTSENTTEDSLIYKNIKGQCGPQTYFQLEKDGTLRITGTGEIDIEQFDDLQNAEISDKVLKVVMDNEITNIPDGMFKNYKNIKEVVDFIVSDEIMNIGCEENLIRLYKEILRKDWFMGLLDFKSYCNKKEEAFKEYENRESWAKKALINISKAGYFSSDRTIEEYNKDIWKLK